mgnify:CR=1 FL=1
MKILPIENLRGVIEIPGDKSISHRSIIFSSLADTPVEIENFLNGADCLSTVACMKSFGADIKFDGDKVLVKGNGLHGLREPENVLDAGNSGTTLRLLLGLAAPQNFITTFTGDSSLRQRPMGRVIKPLTEMGASIVGRNENKNLPITVIPATSYPLPPTFYPLKSIIYQMPVASAQVKSAIILAVRATALFCSGKVFPKASWPKATTMRFLLITGSSLWKFVASSLPYLKYAHKKLHFTNAKKGVY